MPRFLPSAIGAHLRPVALAAGLAFGLLAATVPNWTAPALAADKTSTSNKSSTDTSSGDVVRYRVDGTEGDGLRIRKDAGLDGKVVAYLPEGAVVRQRDDKPVDRDGVHWLPVSATEGQGWVAADYLKRVKDVSNALPNLPSDASFADRAVAYARSQTGQPYAWAGNAPGGFDCSGFVQWVYTKAGLPMERLIEDQLAMGKKVDRDSLKPGDLVAFVNTYQDGVSHVGVYMGNNTFVHASDEAHGVTVSSLSETYWKDHYYRGVRFR